MAAIRPIDANAMHKFVEEKVAEGKDGWANGVPYEWAYALTAVDMQPTLDYVPRQQWISVNDRLPGKKGDYIVNCQHRYNDGFVRNYVTVIYFRGKTQWATGNESISHWMPLPESPKEES